MVTTTRCREQQISCYAINHSQLVKFQSDYKAQVQVNMCLGILLNSSRSTSKAAGCKTVHLRSCTLTLQRLNKDACTWGRKHEYDAENTGLISPRCHHSTHVTLTCQRCTSAPLWSLTFDPAAFQGRQAQQMDTYPTGIRGPMHRTAIQRSCFFCCFFF